MFDKFAELSVVANVEKFLQESQKQGVVDECQEMLRALLGQTMSHFLLSLDGALF